MMKYKLIKEYPGSPKLGTVHTHPGKEWFGTFLYDFNNNEFWEKVEDVKLDVKLSVPIGTKFKISGSDRIFTIDGVLNHTVRVSTDEKLSFTYMIEHVNEFFASKTWEVYEEKDYEILEYFCMKVSKIKRLSDGEIFSVGDKIYWDWVDAEGSKYCTIDMFYYNELNELVFSVKERGWASEFHLEYCKIQHYKEPIFITEDGKECGLYDEIFGILPKGSWEVRYGVKVKCMFNQEGKRWSESTPWKYFSTKEIAEKYIDENKPTYSKKQVREALNESIISLESFDDDKFKSKLGL